MKLVKTEGEFSIFQKRSNRYAVKNKQKNIVSGLEKAKILSKAGLIKWIEPVAKKEEAPTEEAQTES